MYLASGSSGEMLLSEHPDNKRSKWIFLFGLLQKLCVSALEIFAHWLRCALPITHHLGKLQNKLRVWLL